MISKLSFGLTTLAVRGGRPIDTTGVAAVDMSATQAQDVRLRTALDQAEYALRQAEARATQAAKAHERAQAAFKAEDQATGALDKLEKRLHDLEKGKPTQSKRRESARLNRTALPLLAVLGRIKQSRPAAQQYLTTTRNELTRALAAEQRAKVSYRDAVDELEEEDEENDSAEGWVDVGLGQDDDQQHDNQSWVQPASEK